MFIIGLKGMISVASTLLILMVTNKAMGSCESVFPEEKRSHDNICEFSAILFFAFAMVAIWSY